MIAKGTGIRFHVLIPSHLSLSLVLNEPPTDGTGFVSLSACSIRL